MIKLHVIGKLVGAITFSLVIKLGYYSPHGAINLPITSSSSGGALNGSFQKVSSCPGNL